MKEQRNNTGVLFREQSKKSERAPDWTGNLVVEGTVYRIAAWTKQGARGDFLSLAVTDDRTKNDAKPAAAPAPAPQAQPADDTDLPF